MWNCSFSGISILLESYWNAVHKRVHFCEDGYFNNDGDSTNGCEAETCIETNNGKEKCDGIDNNCDGNIDEGYEKNSVTSCGANCTDCTNTL